MTVESKHAWNTRRVGVTLIDLSPPHFEPILSQDLGCRRIMHVVVFFCLHWFNLRDGYLFCWSRCCFPITIETLLAHNKMVYIRRRILVFVFYVVFQITEKLIKRSSSQEFTLAVFNLHPRSKRTIRLNSKDPFDSPRIDPRYLQDLYDVKVLISGKNLLSFMTYHRVCK